MASHSTVPTAEADLPMPVVQPFSSMLFGKGNTYKCPWQFQLPNPLSYSMYVASTQFQREKPTEEGLRPFSMSGPCDFPNFEPNTVWITWLGHASCLFSFFGDKSTENGEPAQPTIRVLCDPNFSSFIGPTQYTGSKRHIPSACQVQDLPEVHGLCISHNHMDHMDQVTLTRLAERMPSITCYVPVGDGAIMRKFGFSDVHEMTWGDRQPHPTKQLSVTFAPASHWSGRGVSDRNCSLWGSFVLESGSHRVFFAGDTGYQEQIFKTIGETELSRDLSS